MKRRSYMQEKMGMKEKEINKMRQFDSRFKDAPKKQQNLRRQSR